MLWKHLQETDTIDNLLCLGYVSFTCFRILIAQICQLINYQDSRFRVGTECLDWGIHDFLQAGIFQHDFRFTVIFYFWADSNISIPINFDTKADNLLQIKLFILKQLIIDSFIPKGYIQEL